MPPSVLSKTLQSITAIKFQELDKQLAVFNKRKQDALDSVQADSDAGRRNKALCDGLKAAGITAWEQSQPNIDQFAEQYRFDPSMKVEVLTDATAELTGDFDKAGRKLNLAHLYSKLLTQWIEETGKQPSEVMDVDRVEGSDESYEVVEFSQNERLEKLREKFAAVVFEPLQTDEVEIDLYLGSLFEAGEGPHALRWLRREVARAGESIRKDLEISLKQLKSSIKGLMRNTLLQQDKRASLGQFLEDDAVLNEIKDVLNMRLKDLESWTWGEAGIPVTPRQALNGTWRIMMDEDVLQAILTHFIGMRWTVAVRPILESVGLWNGYWRHETDIPEEDKAKLRYYLQATHPMDEGIERERQRLFKEDFFLAPLVKTFSAEADNYNEQDEEMSNMKSGKDVRQQLLRTLATEVLLRRHLHGEVAVVQSDFQWFATGLAQSTIFAILRFCGFSDFWMKFFRTVLQPPLDLLDGKLSKKRLRGLPMAHIIEKFLGELILFFLDIAVNQESSTLLYRFHDDLWLVGDPHRCAKAWKSITRFTAVMGLEINKSKTGSVYLSSEQKPRDGDVSDCLPKGTVSMNFLVLDAESGDWVIDQKHVRKHVERLSRQLKSTRSVLEWVRTWNSCIGRFFGYTFGEPANCFGRAHIDSVLETHGRIQKFLFGNEDGTNRSVVTHLKELISSQFDVNIASIPDAFLHLPEALGGLGLHNPFIPLLLRRNGLCTSPQSYLDDYSKNERLEYEKKRKAFIASTEREKRRRYKSFFLQDRDLDDKTFEPAVSWAEAQVFMSFEAYSRYRDVTDGTLRSAYEYFMKTPSSQGIRRTKRLDDGLRFLPNEQKHMKVDSELVWLLEQYADELMETCGGFNMVDRTLLPLGVLKAMNKQTLTWQWVLSG